MRIMVDMDDTVVQFNSALCEALLEQFPETPVALEDITHWDWWNDGSCPVKFPDNGILWTWLREQKGLWANLKPFIGAMRVLKKLHDEGHWIEFVTSKPHWARQECWEWIARYNPPIHGVTMLEPEGPTLTLRSKYAATGGRFDVVIEDNPSTIREFADNGIPVIIYDRPWNRHIDDEPGLIQRADNWGQVETWLTWLESRMGVGV